MKYLIPVLASLSFAGAAQAGLPMLNATCPGGIEVHADQGGPIYFNGKEASLKKFNDNYFEAKGAGITASISVNPDGSASITYTGKGGANGVCALAKSSAGATSAPKPQAARMPANLATTCKGEAAGQMATKPTYVSVGTPFKTAGGFAVKGSVDKGNEGKKPFQCNFDAAGKLKDFESLVDEGKL
jgi:hypothetical protein